MSRAAAAASLACALFVTSARAADPPPAAAPPGGRLFGTDEAPPPSMQPSGPHVVMRLEYLRGPGAEGCPEAQAFRDAVGARVRGWDPFAANAPWRLVVVVARRGAGYEGSAELRDVTGAVEWTRPFPPTARCIDLLEDLAVALALRVDPPRRLLAEPPAAPGPFGPPLPDLPPPAMPAASAPVAFRFGASAWGDLATAPSPAFGLTVDVGFRVAWFSLAGELRWDAPAGATVMEGVDLGTTRLLGALVPCGHVGERVAFVGCVVGEIGRTQGTVTAAGVRAPDHQATLAAAVGPRLGIEIRLAGPLYARGAVDLLGAVKRPRFHLDQATVWESPAFVGGLGVGLGASF